MAEKKNARQSRKTLNIEENVCQSRKITLRVEEKFLEELNKHSAYTKNARQSRKVLSREEKSYVFVPVTLTAYQPQPSHVSAHILITGQVPDFCPVCTGL